MDTFLTWCSDQGIKSDCVDIRQTNYGGHGLFLNTTCTSSAPLIHIPQHLLITASSLLNDSNDKHYSATFIDILDTVLKPDTLTLEDRIKLPGNEKTSIRLFLAYQIDQARKQQSTFWQPYINNLPPLSFFQQNHILFLDDDDDDDDDDNDTNTLFALLEGTSMASSIRAKRASVQREWEQLHSMVPWDLTLEDWMYADILFWSRVVGLTTNDDDDGALAMIPFFDFANHRLDPNIRWQLGKQKHQGLDLVPFDGESIECGQELCLSYGAKSNQELLFLHGFTLDQNPTSGQVTLSLTPFLNPGMGQDGALKCQWLQQQDNPPFKPILVLAQPSNKNTMDTVFGHTGWSFESICMMYLAVLDSDDGLDWMMDNNDSSPDENIADHLDQLHLSSNENTKHGIQLVLAGKPLMTWNDLSAAVLALAHSPVIQLRVVTMLLDASQYHLQQIVTHDDLLKQDNNNDDNDPTLSESPLVPHIVRYRDEERDLLQQSVTTLSDMAEELMDNEIVKEYLDKMNSGVDDD